MNVREWSVLTNPRTPQVVRSSVQHVPLDFQSKPGAEMERLKGLASIKVLNITSYFGSSDHSDLTSAVSGVLNAQEKSAYKKKFGYVAGSWCCAPMDEQKSGAPRSAHFRLSAA